MNDPDLLEAHHGAQGVRHGRRDPFVVGCVISMTLEDQGEILTVSIVIRIALKAVLI